MENENEYALAARYPRLPLIVEGMDYPENIQALIDDTNAAFDRWAEAENEYAVAQEELLDSKAKDALAFKDSVLSGTKDPGDVHTVKAGRQVERTQILLTERLREVNKAAGILATAFGTDAKKIVLAAIAMARHGLETHERMVMEAAQKLSDARDYRYNHLKGLTQVAELTKGIFRFEPNFYQTVQVVMPDLREVRVKNVCDRLDDLLEKGVLFPDSTE